MPADSGIRACRQDGHVEVAVRTVHSFCPGSKDDEDGDPGEILYGAGDLAVDRIHGIIVASAEKKKPGLAAGLPIFRRAG
jgi:hypothetical protein